MACCMKAAKKSSATEPDDMSILLVGLDGAGKTTLKMVWAKEAGHRETVPTVGYDAATTQVGACGVTLVDVGGGPGIRDLWWRYYASAAGAMVVVDASEADTEEGLAKMKETCAVLMKALNHSWLRGKPMPVIANKLDLVKDRKAALKNVKDAFDNIRDICDNWSPVFAASAVNAKRKSDPDNQAWDALVWLKDCAGKMWATLGPRIEKESEDQRKVELAEREKIKARIAAEKAEAEAESHEAAAAGVGTSGGGGGGVTNGSGGGSGGSGEEKAMETQASSAAIKSIVQDAEEVEEEAAAAGVDSEPPPPKAASVLPELGGSSGSLSKTYTSALSKGSLMASSSSLRSFGSAASSGPTLPPLAGAGSASLPSLPPAALAAPPSQVA